MAVGSRSEGMSSIHQTMRPLPQIKTKIEILEELAQVWNDSGYRYAVTNGLQGYPESIGRDLDICFETSYLKPALVKTVEFLDREGFLVLPYHLAWVYWVVGIRENADGSIDSIQVDLFDHLQWAFCWIIDGVPANDECYREGPFQTDYWSPAAKRLILNALSGNKETFEKKPHYLDTDSKEREVMAGHFRRIAGSDFPELREAVFKRDIELIGAEIPAFRASVMKRSLTHWAKIFSRFYSAWQKQWCVNIMPVRTAPIISINGPDEDQLKDWTDGLNDYLESHIVFTCDPVLPIPIRSEKVSGLKKWWELTKKHVRQDRKRSALQVIQIFQNHPYLNSYSQFLGKWSKLKWIIPKPSFVVDVEDHPEVGTKEEFRGLMIRELLKWFGVSSLTARRKLGLGGNQKV